MSDDCFMVSSGCSVCDADLPEFVIDLLWDVYDQLEGDTATLTPNQIEDIRAVLHFMKILPDGKCESCGGTGKMRGRNWLGGSNTAEPVTCPSCGGHGKLTYKRDAMAVKP